MQLSITKFINQHIFKTGSLLKSLIDDNEVQIIILRAKELFTNELKLQNKLDAQLRLKYVYYLKELKTFAVILENIFAFFKYFLSHILKNTSKIIKIKTALSFNNCNKFCFTTTNLNILVKLIYKLFFLKVYCC